MSRLVPTQVVDKNGKQTTVHKKAAAAPSARALQGIAPTLGASLSSRKPFTPTAQQLKPETMGFDVFSSQIDPGLYPLLPHGKNTGAINIRASDVELYKALGNITDTTNAIACFTVRGGVPDAAFLREHQLSHLANTDPARTEMMQAALERKIPAKEFAVFDRKWNAYSDLPTYLDAAQAYSIPTLQKITDFVADVRRGSIRMPDVMEVGMKTIGTLKRSYGPERTRQILAGLADGSANYTTEHLKSVFGRCRNHTHAFAAMRLIDAYGGEYAATVRDFELAHHVMLLCDNDQDKNVRDAVTYIDEFRSRTFRNHKQVYDLYRAGVDLEFGVEHSQKVDATTTQQIIALHEGITNPLTDGWL